MLIPTESLFSFVLEERRGIVLFTGISSVVLADFHGNAERVGRHSQPRDFLIKS